MKLIAATYTPFRKNGEINFDLIPAYAAYLSKNNISGIFVGGTTGEGVSLSIEERNHLIEVWMIHGGDDFQVIAHVGHNALPEAQRLSADAVSRGVDAIAAMAPTYYKGNMDGLIDYYAELSAAAPQTPLFYYHIPAMTGQNIVVHEFLEKTCDRVPMLKGVKFTHEDLMDYYLSTYAAGGAYEMMFGRDEILLAGLSLGAKTAVGSTFNYMAPVYHEIAACYDKGDMDGARTTQKKSMDAVRILRRHGGMACGKLLMTLTGIDMGPCRAPLTQFNDTEIKAIQNELGQINFGNSLSKA